MALLPLTTYFSGRIIFLASFLFIASAVWITRVANFVPEPYLDEVFHVPQAQAYWAGSWKTWDPKITTPPGLYLYSYAVIRTAALLGFASDCGILELRGTNWFLLITLPFLLMRINAQKNDRATLTRGEMHGILNICIFPLLFFFSALYYTDVLSTYMVLMAYYWHLRVVKSHGEGTALRRLLMLLCGLFALGIRQTNVFWAVVFLAGLQAIETLQRDNTGATSGLSSSVSIAFDRGRLHDPIVADAAVEDYAKSILSIGVAALTSLPKLFYDLWPHITMLMSFATFVTWNGGVVLGDKDNHIATLHLAQMLYIWPYIMFFSWPVLLPYFVDLVMTRKTRLPRFVLVVSIMAFVGIIVHFNTLIHPFTLADNRHYVFYVFRILLRHPYVKYAAVPVYLGCAWAAILALGGVQDEHAEETKHGARGSSEAIRQPVKVSFVAVWLAATSLSLITAPLVEPRYFIIPWLMWRLHVPREDPLDTGQVKEPQSYVIRALSAVAVHWLWVETAWFLLVNFATCYMFLYRGFAWLQEPGQVQRFLW